VLFGLQLDTIMTFRMLIAEPWQQWNCLARGDYLQISR